MGRRRFGVRAGTNGHRRDPEDMETPDVPIHYGRLLAYVKPYIPQLIIALIGLLITTAIGLAFPYVIQTLIDSVLQQGNMELLNRITLGLILLFVLRFFIGYAQRYFQSFVGERMMADIRLQLYEHLHSMSLRFFTERRVGEIVSRLASDVSLLRTALINNFTTLISQALTLIGALVIVFLINWRMSLFVLLLGPPMGLIGALFGRWIRRISTEVQDELAGSSVIVEEALAGIRVVKSFVREHFEIQRYTDAINATFRAAMRLARIRAAFEPLTFLLLFVAVGGVLWYGGREVIAGRLTAGGLTSFLFYLVFIAASFGVFAGLYGQIQEAIGATRRIFELLDLAPDVQDRPGAEVLNTVEGQLCFEDVWFTYDERIDVIQGISLEVQPGEVLALVGPSGAGKSTVFNLIPRFYDPNQGRVCIDGRDLRHVTQKSLREQIGIVPQETMLFGGTIRENILYGKLDASEEELTDAAKAANAHEFITAFPDGYDTMVGERGVKLSGGQRQRIAIARALLKNPRILLLDEATSSLDSESEGLVQEALERLMQGRTTVIIAHRLSTVQIADRVAVLDQGKLVELGTHGELLAKDGLYARLHSLQFRLNGV